MNDSGMVKIIRPDGWDFGQYTATLVKVSSRGLIGADRADFIKVAGASAPIFLDAIDHLKLAKDETPIHEIALGAGEWWGCFVAGTAVRMGDGGLKPIEQVTLGEEVVTHKGRRGTVVTTYARPYAGDGVRLMVSGLLDDVTCTANHKFYVIPADQVACAVDATKHCKPGTCQTNALCAERRCSRAAVSYEPEWREAGTLRPGDYVLMPIPDRGIGSSGWAWSPAMARLVGYFLAEGCYAHDKKKQARSLQFAFGDTEVATLGAKLVAAVHELQSEHAKLKVSGPYLSKGSAAYHLSGAQALSQRLQAVVGEYSYGKCLGAKVYGQPPDVLATMIAAWVDGDGTCPVYTKANGYAEHRYTAVTVSRRLALDMQWVLQRLGTAASVCAVPAEPARNRRESYHVSFGNAAGEFMAGLADKHRSCPPAQCKEHSFCWNGYVCRPLRAVTPLVLATTVYNLEVEGDHTYTVGNGIAVKNCNRNGDRFDEHTCRTCHPSFVKNARSYRDHKNKDPRHSYGTVKLSAYNEQMHRVELLTALNATKEAARRNGGLVADRELQKLASGKDLGRSMACRVAHDVCSSCGNTAKTRADYCDEQSCVGPKGEKRGGCKHNLTKIGEDGHTLCVDNPNPFWFDISDVARPADRIAYGGVADYLQKAASAGRAIGGAEMAEILGVTAPPAVLWAGFTHANPRVALQVKLAAALAALEQQPATFSPATLAALSLRPAVGAAQLGLVGAPLTEKSAAALATLADARVFLTPAEFAAWMGHPELAAKTAAAAPEIFTHLISRPDFTDMVARNPFLAVLATEKVAAAPARALARALEKTAALSAANLQDHMLRAALRGAIKSAADVRRANGAVDGTGLKLATAHGLYTLAALSRLTADSEFSLTARLLIGQNRAY